MSKKNQNSSVITQDCTNFRNFLRDTLGLENFNDFIFSYAFPLQEIEDLKAAAKALGKEPVALRLYYGCAPDGKNHKLYMSLLDNNQEVIVDSSTLNSSGGSTSKPHHASLLASTTTAIAAIAPQERKCPPGGTSNDRLISGVFS
ncbi:hypothetical protein HUW51_22240 [Adhaeribacter swui]|uniref:Uncharacterized protein n=1 Tax=Adhaeribacter swui TaxID=2086471 RepID=A0A7G7GDS0_9BACT|nr:hypothetical protein [Adhaeribacter swui]QNF35304.1 hypothetical protein HUW51_22240 [Adhaeribacter swui]